VDFVNITAMTHKMNEDHLTSEGVYDSIIANSQLVKSLLLIGWWLDEIIHQPVKKRSGVSGKLTA
jgi:hypothetical protein